MKILISCKKLDEKSDIVQENVSEIKIRQITHYEKINKIESNVTVLSEKIANMEKLDRLNNLILYGVEESDNINRKLFTYFKNLTAELDIKVVLAFRSNVDNPEKRYQMRD